MNSQFDNTFTLRFDGRSKVNFWIRSSLILSLGILIGIISTRLYYSEETQISDAQKTSSDEEVGGYLLEDAKMNDVMGWLAKKEGMQYWYNAELDDPKYNVNGHMNVVTNPRSEIDEFALGFGLHVKSKDDTLYILTPDQYDVWSKRPAE